MRTTERVFYGLSRVTMVNFWKEKLQFNFLKLHEYLYMGQISTHNQRGSKLLPYDCINN